MIKKLLSLVCALAMVLSLTVTAFAADAPDGHSGLWYDEDYGYYYYYENGEKVTEDYREYEGNLYYFDWSGDSERGGFVDNNGEAHFATKDFLVVTGTDLDLAGGTGWYYDDYFDEWYYFYADGTIAYDETVTIDGKRYNFDSYGEMTIGIFSEYVYDEDTEYWYDKYYVTDQNGAVVTQKGWYEAVNEYGDSFWCYIIDSTGLLIDGGYHTINGVKYYFYSDGSMAVGPFDVYDEESENWVYYLADSNGKLITAKGWHEITFTYDEYGTYSEWYYVKADGKLVTDGFFEVGGKTYYFGYNGYLYTGTFSDNYYDNDLDEWVYKYYVADYNGVVSTAPGWAKVEVYKGDVEWFYILSDSTVARNCVMTIGDADYGFRYWGEMYTGKFYDDQSGTYLIADDNGKIMNKPNTWYKLYDKWYYTKDDTTLATNEILTISGKNYVFNNSSEMIVGYGYSNGEYYYTDSTGAIYKNKWIQENFNWYYAKADGTLAHNEWISNNYYFNHNSTMVVGTYYTNDYGYCVFDNNGNYITRAGKVKGWQKLDGYWYYYDAVGEPHNGWQKDGNKWYYFENGRMCTSDIIYEDDKMYYVDKTGAMLKNGWIESNYGSWYYAYADGSLATGWQKIGSKWYYFEDYGYWYNLEIQYIYDYETESGEWHRFNSSGAWVEKLPDNTWVKDSQGNWYYITHDEPIYGEYKVNGTTYYFDYNRMRTNDSYDGLWLDANGKIDKGTGWRQDDDGDWYYLEKGNLVYDLKKIGGKWYNFDPEMTIGYNQYYNPDNGKYEYGFFAGDGAWQKIGTGWYSVNYKYYGNSYTDWYYFKNGKPMSTGDDSRALFTIGGKKYMLNDDGYAYTGSVYSENSCYYIFDQNGQLSKGGWVKVDGDWYYTDSTGRAYMGEHKIGGKTYYFDYDGMML